MLKYIKRQIMELLETLREAKPAVREAIAVEEELLGLLADAQDAAVAIGDKIEMSGTSAGLIGLLETYCEYLWKVTQAAKAEEKMVLVEEAWEILDKVSEGITEIPARNAIVFMPYKASMWDCMESVWKAACEDPDWEPFVVPIPYMDLKDGEVIAHHYEGANFPPEVPVLFYQDFPLAELHPEAIYIHNPFDDYNIVTRVLPQFYSSELKKVTDRLIYCPYYVTGEGVFVTHRDMPSYQNMDFIVTQCEKMIDSYSSRIPREKFLPFGSPIADRILFLENEKPAIPAEWLGQLKNGKDFGTDRTVMLNTSISLFMKQRERFLDKIEYVIDLTKQIKGITLIWRPHPLLHATAQTMGEEYAARLASLEEKFIREKAGVLDRTPDVGVTVALCDAYLGETASSMIHMFGIAGKPRFYVNLQIPDDLETEDVFQVSAHTEAEGKEYFVLDKPGWIVEREKGAEKFRLLVRIPGREYVGGRAYAGMEWKDGRLWVYPENAKGVFIYEMKTGGMRKVFEGKFGSKLPYNKIQEQDSIVMNSEISAQRGGISHPLEGRGDENDGSSHGIFSQEMMELKLDEECLAGMRAERFQRGNLAHEWYEGDKSTVEDFFYFMRTAREEELKGHQGSYQVWLATLDGSCGRKILQAVKESLAV